MFNGKKLKELRILYGMSREQLARKTGATEQEIWSFETNKVKPKVLTVLTLANLFKVNINFFEAEPLTSYINMENISFHKGDLDSEKMMRMQCVYINVVHSLMDILENYLISPPRIIYSLSEKVNNVLFRRNMDKKTIEKIANMARKSLDVSSHNDNLLYKLELSGINILSRFNTNNLNGKETYSLWSRDNVPYMALVSGKSFTRRNYDLAHELGHLLLHRAVDFENLDSSEREKKEQEADIFALSFLMPDTEFKEFFEKLVGDKSSQPDGYITLKQHFNVSIQILEHKAFKIGQLTIAQNNHFYREFYKKKYNVSEPLDRDTPVYKAGKILSMLDMVFTNNLIDIQSLVLLMHISKEMLADILNIESIIFDKYKMSRNDYSRIIRLSDEK